MTEIAFHFNIGHSAADKLHYACRLMRKAVAAGARIMVVADSAKAGQLDRLLWTFSPLEFIPHCVLGAPSVTQHMVGVSPVILSQESSDYPHQEVMLNLLDGLPTGFEAFRRVIEIVSQEDPDRLQARSRWKRYTELGYTITRHDIALQGA